MMVAHTEIQETEQSLVVTPELKRMGNSPYLGMMYARVYGNDGILRAEKEAPAYFYFNDWRTFTFDKADLGEGPYRVDFEFETRRRSLNSSDIVKAQKQVHSINIMD
jgi:hypothetical protein